MEDAPQSKHARSFRGHQVEDGRSKSGAPDVGLEYLSIDIDISASEGIVTGHHMDACAVGGVTPAVAGIVAVEVGRVIALEVTIAAIGFSSNHTDVVDVEFLSGDAELLNVSGQDDLTSNEARVGVVGHEDISTAKAGSAHVVDVVHKRLAVDAQVLEAAVIDELELDLLHSADTGQVVDSGEVVQPQHLSVTGFRLGVHDVGGAEVGRPIEVHDVLEGQVDAVLCLHGHSRTRDGDGAEGHQLMGELHVAAVNLVRSSTTVCAHILTVSIRAVRVIEICDGHTDELARLCDGVSEDVSCRHRDAIERPIEVARRSDVVEFGHTVADVHRGEGGMGEAGNVNRTVRNVDDSRDFHHQHRDGLQDEDTEVDRQRGQAGPGEEKLSSAEILDIARHGAILVGEADAERVDLVFPNAEVDGQQGLTAVGVQAGELDVDPVEEGGVTHRSDVRHSRSIVLTDAEVVNPELLAADLELVDVADQHNPAVEADRGGSAGGRLDDGVSNDLYLHASHGSRSGGQFTVAVEGAKGNTVDFKEFIAA